MRKIPFYATVTLFAAYGLYPLGVLIARIFGYEFSILSEPLWYLLLIAGTVGCFRLLKNTEETFTICGLFPLLGMANWLCSMKSSLGALLLSVILFFCSFLIMMRHSKVHWVKVMTLGITGLLCMPLLGLSLLGNMVSSSQNNVVVYTETSPSGTHYLEHIENWQTDKEKNIIVIVKVYENSGFDIGLCSAAKRPVKVYVGEREKEAECIFEVNWKDNECVLIEGKEYPIN